MRMLRLAGLGVAIGVLPPTAPAQEQTPEQRRCVTKLLGAARGATTVQSRINVQCVRGAGGGRVADLSACLAADQDGALAAARQGTAAAALARCAASPPDFGAPAAFEQTVNEAAVVHQRG